MSVALVKQSEIKVYSSPFPLIVFHLIVATLAKVSADVAGASNARPMMGACQCDCAYFIE